MRPCRATAVASILCAKFSLTASFLQGASLEAYARAVAALLGHEGVNLDRAVNKLRGNHFKDPGQPGPELDPAEQQQLKNDKLKSDKLKNDKLKYDAYDMVVTDTNGKCEFWATFTASPFQACMGNQAESPPTFPAF